MSLVEGAKNRKMSFFAGCPVGWGGVPTGAGLVDGGVDQGPWFQGRVGGSWKGQGVREGLAWWGKLGGGSKEGRAPKTEQISQRVSCCCYF